MALKHLVLSLVLLLAVAITTPAFAEGPYATIKIIPEHTKIEANDTLTIAIEQTLADDWHTYWVNPGDSGTPLEIDWTLPEGFVTSDIQWPVPEKIPFGPLANYGYHHSATLLQTIETPDNIPAGPITLEAEVTVLVCKEICIPETSKHSITLNDGSEVDNSAIINEALNAMPITAEWGTQYRQDRNFFVLDLDMYQRSIIPDNPGHLGLDLIPYQWGIVRNDAPTVTERGRGNVMRLTQWRGEKPLEEAGLVKFLIAYKDDEGKRAGIEITAMPDPVWLEAAKEKKTLAKTETVTETIAPQADEPGPAGISLLTALLFALLGGIILNLMPCVFPILSMKALGLSRMSDAEQSHALTHGLLYTAGVMASFAVLASLLMILKAGGAQIGWGFQLQNPSVVYALALLLFVLGLNLSGVFSLPTNFSGLGGKLSAQGGKLGDFFTGVLATLVATPCTAPFMGAALGFALTQPMFSGFAVFMALGFGLALPYLLLTTVPACRRLLPRPGAWMETFRQFLAFPMYASAAWLVWVFVQQTEILGVFAALCGMIATAFALWAWPRRPATSGKRLAVTLFVLATLAAGWGFAFAEGAKGHQETSSQPRTTEIAAGHAEPYTKARLDELLAGDAPVFVNMTAAWCITCKLNERVALDVKATKDLFSVMGVHYLKGDWTNQNTEITEYLDRYGRKGVPIYVYYGPRDTATKERPEAVVLPQVLTPALIAETVGKAK